MLDAPIASKKKALRTSTARATRSACASLSPGVQTNLSTKCGKCAIRAPPTPPDAGDHGPALLAQSGRLFRRTRCRLENRSDSRDDARRYRCNIPAPDLWCLKLKSRLRVLKSRRLRLNSSIAARTKLSASKEASHGMQELPGSNRISRAMTIVPYRQPERENAIALSCGKLR